MQYVTYHEYLPYNGADLFTIVCLPQKEGIFPTVIWRSPYVDDSESLPEETVCAQKLQECAFWVENGYAVVFQHCRGCGKSSGDCIPYVNERADGLFLQNWIRKQPFYNGELFLYGHSYTSSVHYLTAPFAPDIKGAVLEGQDTERYNCNYRNGFYKIGLHGGWYVNMYRKKSIRTKPYTPGSYNMLPLSDFSKAMFGEPSDDFDAILRHPDRNDPFWQTPLGGVHTRGALDHVRIPVLLITGFYDIYCGGVFDMWRNMDETARAKCALAVHPYEHDGTGIGEPVHFRDGFIRDPFGNYPLRWMDYIRGKGQAPFEPGKVTYYKLFGDTWCTDSFEPTGQTSVFLLGEGERTYHYDPSAPPQFKGGLSTNFGGTEWQDPPGTYPDVVTFCTPKFSDDTFVKGKMTARLCVRSSAEDTCFYMRISLCKAEGDYGLRDDINQISNFCANYTPGDAVEMTFTFDEHAFVIQKGEKLRVDIASAAFPHYVRHTNQKGLFSEQGKAVAAENTVLAERSSLTIPIACGHKRNCID